MTLPPGGFIVLHHVAIFLWGGRHSRIPGFGIYQCRRQLPFFARGTGKAISASMASPTLSGVTHAPHRDQQAEVFKGLGRAETPPMLSQEIPGSVLRAGMQVLQAALDYLGIDEPARQPSPVVLRSAADGVLLRDSNFIIGCRINRYSEDEARQALQQVMPHPRAQAAFRQRKAKVEPVLSALRRSFICISGEWSFEWRRDRVPCESLYRKACLTEMLHKIVNKT